VIADDVALASLSDSVAQLALEGPGARDAARAIGGAAPAPGHFARAEFAGGSVLWLAEGSVTADGLRAIAPRELAAPLAEALALPTLDDAAAELLRLDAALPLFGRDVGVRNFPQEARLERALSFTKGCYIGQEIVARPVARRREPGAGQAPRPNGRSRPARRWLTTATRIGQVTSSAALGSGRGLALAYLKVDHAGAGQRVVVGGVAGGVAGADARR
jgi:folate-binding protein YgfZ